MTLERKLKWYVSMLVLNYENVNGNIISIKNTNLVHDKLHRGYDKDDK